MKKLILLLTLTLAMMFGQTEWTTRIYEYEMNTSNQSIFYIDLFEITGYDLEQASINVISLSDYNFENNYYYSYACDDLNASHLFNLSGVGFSLSSTKAYNKNDN